MYPQTKVMSCLWLVIARMNAFYVSWDDVVNKWKVNDFNGLNDQDGQPLMKERHQLLHFFFLCKRPNLSTGRTSRSHVHVDVANNLGKKNN